MICCCILVLYTRTYIWIRALSVTEPAVFEGTGATAHMTFSHEEFARVADRMLRRAPGLNKGTSERRFRGLFGVTPHICSLVWTLLRDKAPCRASPKFLLWALLFLKVYATEHVNAGISGVNEKPFRKWQWIFVRLISELDIASVPISTCTLRNCTKLTLYDMLFHSADIMECEEIYSANSVMLGERGRHRFSHC